MTEGTKLLYMANHVYREGYNQGRADVLEALLEKDWWNKHQKMVLIEWLAEAKRK